jgi:pantothenate kinase
MAARVEVSRRGEELLDLRDRALGALDRRFGQRDSTPGRLGRRRMIGIAGEPGAGKSLLAVSLVALMAPRAVVVPLDGFHLADSELDRQGIRDRKGAPETFDAWGYAALLARLRGRPEHTVYAPAFERDLEQPLAGAVAVPGDVDVVVTEGNYLLLDTPAWLTARSELDEVWFVHVDRALRLDRLVARHETFGKSPSAARRWVEEVDEPNARLVAARRGSADLVVDLTAWAGAANR